MREFKKNHSCMLCHGRTWNVSTVQWHIHDYKLRATRVSVSINTIKVYLTKDADDLLRRDTNDLLT